MTQRRISFHAFVVFVLLMTTIVTDAKAAPRDSSLRHGRLPNGLTYYIARGGGTPGMAHYYMFQNVGAILEDDSQKGLAHVLEHLAFNTTAHFPKGVMNFLRKNGLNNFSAYTGVDETRYAVHDVPVAFRLYRRRMLEMLYDWCHGLRFTPADVDKERAIILEEWRQRNDVDHRMANHIAPTLYNGSKYGRRNVIGNEQALRTFKAADVRRFYDTWYRPSLQYIAIVGDIDPVAMEQEVRAMFDSLPAREVPPHAHMRRIADNKRPGYTRFIDAENASPSFGLYERRSSEVLTRGVGAVREDLFSRIFNRLAPRRFAVLRNAGEEQFIAAEVSLSPMVRGYSQLAWDVVPYEDRGAEALQQLVDVREDIRRRGFGREEFDAVCTELYNGMKELSDNDHALGTPDNLMSLFRRNFLYGDSIVGFREQLRASMDELVEMEVGEMNAWVRSWMNDDNLSFVTYSRTADEMNISPKQVARAMKSAAPVRSATVAPPPSRLPATPPTPGKIVSDKKIDALGAVEWKLSNGATVYYKHVADGSGRVYFAGSAAGGRAAVAPADLPSYTAMKALVMQSGVDKYNRNRLHEWVKDKQFDLTISLGDRADGVGGNTAVAHADDFFGYLYLVLTRQRFDREVFDKYLARTKYIYTTRSTKGMAAVQDSIRELLYPYTPANPKEDSAFYSRMRYEDLSPLFDRSFGNAGRFKFCLVGDLPEAEARRLATCYLAALPGTPDSSARPLHSLDFSSPERIISRTFVADTDGDVGEVELTRLNDTRLSVAEQAALEVFRGILENRLFAILRERDHAVYSVGVKADYNEQPTPGVVLSIHFSTSRKNTISMKTEALWQLREIVSGSFSDDEFKAVQVPLAVSEQEDEGIEGADADPMFWMAALNIYAEQGRVPDLSAAQPSANYRNLTADDVVAVAAKLLKGARARNIVVRSPAPEERHWER